jgi:hypothetical protein
MADAFVTLYQQGFRAFHAGAYEAATAALVQALQLRPDHQPAIAGLGMALLGQGLYPQGWPLYEARKRAERTPLDGGDIPEWDGSPLDGRRLLIWPEQGLGDEIQMARYAPLLARAGKVTLACSAPLARLFEQLGADIHVRADGVPPPTADVWVRNFSLPGLLGTTLETIPPAPYLAAPSEPKRGGVGFVWRGDPTHANDSNRSLPSPDVLAPLADVAELVDLQPPRGDFLDTAARIQALDLVVTVDTSMAHLAGALGVPCFVMLPALGCDWRWLRDRSDSPWYPSLRLYRQSRPGDWSEVVGRMRADLAAH